MNEIKAQIIRHLESGEAFMPLLDMIDEAPFGILGKRPHGLPYSIYEQFYHIVYAQKDILDFCVADTYEAPAWPADYWPAAQAPADEGEWQDLKQQYRRDRDALSAFAKETQLESIVKHGDRQSALRELLLVIEHTAYHTGQILILLRLQGAHSS